MRIKGTKITVVNGIIRDGDRREIGTVLQALKFGYHPAVRVKIGPSVEWFEQDEDKLIEKIFEHIRVEVKG